MRALYFEYWLEILLAVITNTKSGDDNLRSTSSIRFINSMNMSVIKRRKNINKYFGMQAIVGCGISIRLQEHSMIRAL
jgi:hypothetical protein